MNADSGGKPEANQSPSKLAGNPLPTAPQEKLTPVQVQAGVRTHRPVKLAGPSRTPMSERLKQVLWSGLAMVVLVACCAFFAWVWWYLATQAQVPVVLVWGFLALWVLGPLVYIRGNRGLPIDLVLLEHEERLARLLHFTPRDLDSNRSGRMSWMQRLRLLRGDLGWWGVAVFCIAGPLASFFAAEPGQVARNADASQGKLSLMLLGIVGVGIWASYRAITSGLDVLGGRVVIQRTQLQPREEQGVSEFSVCRVRTNDGHNLKVWRAVYDEINSSKAYVVYFAPLSKQLVSLEATLNEPEPRHGMSHDTQAAGDLLRRALQGPLASFAREKLGQTGAGWAIALFVAASFMLVVGIWAATQSHAWTPLWPLNIVGGLLSYVPFVLWVVYRNRLPNRPLFLWPARVVALILTVAIPFIVWGPVPAPI
jgi:hypothetical protein